ncbi:NAD(P)-dependent oxidoreductase [Paenibacillus sp. GCM10023252]|uniref:NAD(P)-dependent oxidoreductase n=1 Tax=Paenibacillus sp. GCM10023252 TaxID=3252649 RepID=UPI003616D383
MNRITLVIHASFDRIWPLAGDRLHELLSIHAEVDFIRLPQDSELLLSKAVPDLDRVECLISIGTPITEACLRAMPSLKEAFIGIGRYAEMPSAAIGELLRGLGIRQLKFSSVGYWGQSVSEFALGLTIAALRRIPQTHHSIMSSYEAWQYPLEQFGDDPRFVNGTVEGKRVRIVGAGNIASRYAKFMHMLGADVAVWDPFAADQAFHLAGSRRVRLLEHLLHDADIFVPMVPLTPATTGLINAEHIQALPTGALVVLVTRSQICDMAELTKRVLANELTLAADVYEEEPLPLGHPLLGRTNVVHTPHNAGRTKEANWKWAEMLAEQIV